MRLPTSVAERLASLARFGAGKDGLDRGLFTAPEHAARAAFASWCAAAGLSLSQDSAGNIFARRDGRQPGAPPLLVGSHLDTVRGGGAYDGAYGVVAALCALERLAAEGVALERSVEAVAWAGEEGSRFPLGCLGSAAYAGVTPLAAIAALVDGDGVSFAAARDGATGLLPDVHVRDTDGATKPAAYLEIHVEQGPVLEAAGARLGIVTAIAGQRRFAVHLAGEQGHAGTVPMAVRHDALCAAAEVVLRLEAAALETGACVATVGALDVAPNQTNVIAGSVALRVDARSVDDRRCERLELVLRDACREIAARRGVAIAVEALEFRPAVAMDERLRATLRSTVATLGQRPVELASGAGHDAMCLARIAPAAMLFVPSAGGRSHVRDEFTAAADLELGVAALARAIADIDASLANVRPV